MTFSPLPTTVERAEPGTIAVTHWTDTPEKKGDFQPSPRNGTTLTITVGTHLSLETIQKLADVLGLPRAILTLESDPPGIWIAVAPTKPVRPAST